MAITSEDRAFLDRIARYADRAMPDLDPQKTPVSVQLDRLMPVFEEIAGEQNTAVEDILIRYMDLASEAFVASSEKVQEVLGDTEPGEGMFRIS